MSIYSATSPLTITRGLGTRIGRCGKPLRGHCLQLFSLLVHSTLCAILPNRRHLLQIYPDSLLDANNGIYDATWVNDMVQPHRNTLLTLFYSFVHPNLPVLGHRQRLEANIASGAVPASLLAAIYAISSEFWSHSSEAHIVHAIDRQALLDFVFRSTMLEARTPSLHTVQAMLLLLHSAPSCVREPNHPGCWGLTSQVSSFPFPIDTREFLLAARLLRLQYV